MRFLRIMPIPFGAARQYMGVDQERLEEDALIEAARRGEEQAFLTIFDAHQGSLYRFALRLGIAEPVAEEIVQEVFLSLLRRRNGYEAGRGALRRYLLGAVRNLAWKHLGKMAESPLGTAAAPHCPAGTPESLVCRQEVRDAVAHAVGMLPAQQREVILLAHYEQMPVAGMAALLGIEPGAVKSRLQRARASLRAMLAPMQTSKLKEREP